MQTYTHTSKQKIRSEQWSWWKTAKTATRQQQRKHRTTTEKKERIKIPWREICGMLFFVVFVRDERVGRVSSQIYLWTEWNDLDSLAHSYVFSRLLAHSSTRSCTRSLARSLEKSMHNHSLDTLLDCCCGQAKQQNRNRPNIFVSQAHQDGYTWNFKASLTKAALKMSERKEDGWWGDWERVYTEKVQ